MARPAIAEIASRLGYVIGLISPSTALSFASLSLSWPIRRAVPVSLVQL